MKKLICLLTLAVLLLPMVAAAQNTCCQMKGNIKYDNVTYNNNVWIGEAQALANTCASNNTVIPNTDCSTMGATVANNCYTSKWGIICLLSTVNRIFSIVFVILIALAGIMIVIGAFTIVTAGGDPQKVTSGRNYILYAMVGLVVAIFARAIPAIVMLLV